jgi:hypothetical protein
VRITITPEQVARLRAMVEPLHAAHANADCEPPGFSITIQFLGPFGTHAVAQCSGSTIDLGDVDVSYDPAT